MDIKYILLFIVVRFAFIAMFLLYVLILGQNKFYFYAVFLQRERFIIFRDVAPD